MRDLDLINPNFAKPKNLCSIGAIIPFILCLSCIALYNGAAKPPQITSDLFLIILILFCALSFSLIFIPHIFQWDWSAKYFFVSSIEMSSMGLLALVPWICFLFYSTVSVPIRVAFFLLFVIFSTRPSYNFVKMYLQVKNSRILLDFLYQKEGDKIFYIQKNDSYLIEKKFKLRLYPNSTYFIFFSITAFIITFFAKSISVAIGLPFPHIFLGIFAIPINMMALSFFTRSWMVFLYLPKYYSPLKQMTYVDMHTKSTLNKKNTSSG